MNLDLSRNRLKEISPDVFPNLPNMECLNLNYNLLSKVDKGFARFPSLSRLGLLGNLITSIPFFVLKMPALTHLELEWDAVAQTITHPPGAVIPQPNNFTLDLTQLKSRFKSYSLRYKVTLTPATEMSLYFYLEHSISGQLDSSSSFRGCLFAAKNSFPGVLQALLNRLGPCPSQDLIASIVGVAIEGRPPSVLPGLVKKFEELPSECFGEYGNPASLTIKMAGYDPALIKSLASAQVNLHGKDRRGNTLLHCLLTEGVMLQSSTIESLVCPWKGSGDTFPLEARNLKGDTALLAAARGQLRQQIKTAMTFHRELQMRGVQGFDWNAEDREASQTVLHLLCYEPSLLLLTELQNITEVDPIVLDDHMKTPISYIPKIFVTSRKLVLKWELGTILSRWTRTGKVGERRLVPIFKDAPKVLDSPTGEQPPITDGRSGGNPPTVFDKVEDPSSGRGNINIMNSTCWDKGEPMSSSRRSLLGDMPKPHPHLVPNISSIGSKKTLHLRPRSGSLFGKNFDFSTPDPDKRNSALGILPFKPTSKFNQSPDGDLSGRKINTLFKTQIPRKAFVTPTGSKERKVVLFGNSNPNLKAFPEREGIVLNQTLVNRFASLQKIGNSILGLSTSQKAGGLVANKLSLRLQTHSRMGSSTSVTSDTDGFTQQLFSTVNTQLVNLEQMLTKLSQPMPIHELTFGIGQLSKQHLNLFKVASIWQKLKHGATLKSDSEAENQIVHLMVGLFPKIASLLVKLITRGRYQESSLLYQLTNVHLRAVQAFHRKSHAMLVGYLQDLLKTLKSESVWNTSSGFPLAKEYDHDRDLRAVERQSRAQVLSRNFARDGMLDLWEHKTHGGVKRAAPLKKMLSLKISKSLQRPSMPLDWLTSQLATQKATELSATSKSRGIASQISM